MALSSMCNDGGNAGGIEMFDGIEAEELSKVESSGGSIFAGV